MDYAVLKCTYVYSHLESYIFVIITTFKTKDNIFLEKILFLFYKLCRKVNSLIQSLRIVTGNHNSVSQLL